MEELYKFMNHSNATLDLKVGNELATEPLPEGEVAEVCPRHPVSTDLCFVAVSCKSHLCQLQVR